MVNTLSGSVSAYRKETVKKVLLPVCVLSMSSV